MPGFVSLGLGESSVFAFKPPVGEKTYIFKELYIEIIVRNPKKVGLFGYR